MKDIAMLPSLQSDLFATLNADTWRPPASRYATLDKDDQPIQRPMRISGFASFRRRDRPPIKMVDAQQNPQPTQQQQQNGCENELANLIFSSVRRHKTRGRECNSPTQPQVRLILLINTHLGHGADCPFEKMNQVRRR